MKKFEELYKNGISLEDMVTFSSSSEGTFSNVFNKHLEDVKRGIRREKLKRSRKQKLDKLWTI